MCKIKGLSEVKVEKIKEAAGKLMVCKKMSTLKADILTSVAFWIYTCNCSSRA
jgi:hypothetical protein